MADEHTYTTSLAWSETTRGVISSSGLPEIHVATPPQFPGGIEGHWSPEHMFVASAEICLMTTFLAIAANSRLEFVSYNSEADGTLEKTENGYEFTKIVVRSHVVISDESKVERARRILEKAEEHCLISKSMKTPVELDAKVTIA
ncbi:MAG: OsmC family protein [Spirochaetales bacterium]|nr:OsmC family protein [Spirochaetales bacterium]